MLTVNDFFCGAGGMALGFKKAGFQIVGAWDFDKYAVDTYRTNFGDYVQLADVAKLQGEDISTANVWTFGFPCQDLSTAGQKKGLVEGERSRMFFEIMRLLEEVEQKPEIIVAENVKELKRWLPMVEQEYDTTGYIMYVGLLNSKYWGVAQNRERYFVVGVRKDVDRGHFLFPHQETDHIPKLAAFLESDVPEKYYLNDEKAAKIIQIAMSKYKNPQDAYIDKDGCAYACSARYFKGASYADVLKSRNTQVVETGIMFSNRAASFTDVSNTLLSRNPSTALGNCTPITGVAIKVFGSPEHYGNDQMNRVYAVDGIAPTLKTMSGGGRGVNIFDPPKFRVRRLTPREYARLQGFPDSFTFNCSDTQIYRQMGNAVTVHVAQAMAQAVKHHLMGVMNMNIDNNFKFHAPKEGQPERYTAIREKAKELAHLIDQSCPTSREKSVAFTELETAVMWANASIARNE